MSTRTGRPPRLSRDQIVAAARELVAAHGVQSLTMRRLATELGATPMALYRHVRDREELLVLLLEDIAASDMLRPELPDDPRERIVATALAMHDGLAQVPWIVEILTGDEFFAPSALWYAETIVDAAMGLGLTEADAVHVYRSVWYYTAGELIIRAAPRPRSAEPGATFRDKVFADLDPESLPRLAALGERYADLATADTYERGLRALVSGLLDARE